METHAFTFADFLTTGESFLTSLVAELEEKGIPARSMESDHLCFRVSTLEEYEFYKIQLSACGQLLTEAPVNGRPICTFKLQKAFSTGSHTVPLVELPAPKPGSSYASGFEHAEFLINESFDSFKARFSQLSFEPVGKKTINPELCLKLDGKQAKFHHHSLEQIIEIERSTGREGHSQ